MSGPGWIAIGLLVGLPVVFAWTAARAGRPRAAADRCQVLAAGGSAAVGLVLGRAFVPWVIVPPLLWGAAFALAAWGAVTAALAWPRLLTAATRRPRLRLLSTGLGLAVNAAVVALML